MMVLSIQADGLLRKKMKNNYKVLYNGNSFYRGKVRMIMAESKREAVEKVYQEYMDKNYFPEEDGTIKDCDGNIIAKPEDDKISYDGGFFYALESFYTVRIKAIGEALEDSLTLSQAQKTIEYYEEMDMEEGVYVPNSYEIYNCQTNTVV